MRDKELAWGQRPGEGLLTLLAAFAIMIAVAVCLSGCATKTRSVDLDGMYVSEAGTLAIGSVEVMAAPLGEESVSIRYVEDTAWLSPSTKTHAIKIMLTGTNSVSSVGGIVSDICAAFGQCATNAPGCQCATNAPSCQCATSADAPSPVSLTDI